MEDTWKEKEFTRKRALLPFIKRIFKYSFVYKKWCYALVGGAILTALVDGSLPLIWYRYIDDFITPTVLEVKGEGWKGLSPEALEMFYRFGLLYLLMITLLTVGIVIFVYCAGRLNEYVIYDLRKAMFAKLQQLPYAFYDRSAIGWLSIRLTSDVDRVSEVISFGFVSLISGFMMIVVSLSAMFYYNWQLGLGVSLSIPLMMVLSIRLRMLILKYARRARRVYSQMAAFLTENINGVEVNKSTVHEESSAEEFRGLSNYLKESSYRAAWYTAMYRPLIVLLGSLVAAMVIYFGAAQVLNPATGFTLGLLAAFFGYARMIFDPIMEITQFYASAQDSLSAGERIFSLIDEPITLKDRPGAQPIQGLQGDIRFEKVGFHYVPDKPIIQNLDLHIRSGESLALVGSTGEGKSTLINLICRFYEPSSGLIRIDGVDYKDISLQSYRQQLGVILQSPYLFSGTIRENICYGKLDASDVEIFEALDQLGMGDYRYRLDERVGEEGNELSAGEKQLISFARVVVKNPAILIMDEATSSIDTLAEQKIQQGIEQLLKDRTAIIIAHRLSTIRHCDRILVVHQGKIVEEGNHQELLEKKGRYHSMYTSQMQSMRLS